MHRMDALKKAPYNPPLNHHKSCMLAGTGTATSIDEMASASELTPCRLIPELPDELSMNCIARVPCSSHPDLALVSHAWHSLLRSPLLFTLRTDLGATENTLYLNIRTPAHPSRWYVLHLRPARLLPLPPTPIPSFTSAFVALGRQIFLLGGSYRNVPSAAVQILDPRFNRWAPGPDMAVARQFAAAGVMDGRIYVVGGCMSPSGPWAETLDGSGFWAPVPSPPQLQRMDGSGEQVVAEDGGEGVVLDPAAAMLWGAVSEALHAGCRGVEAMVDGILYSYSTREKLMGYDGVADEWKAVKGVEREMPEFVTCATMTNLGGLLCFVWKGSRRGIPTETEINCVGIKVTRTSCGGFWASVRWRETAIVPLPVVTLLGSVALEF